MRQGNRDLGLAPPAPAPLAGVAFAGVALTGDERADSSFGSFGPQGLGLYWLYFAVSKEA